MIQPKKNFQHSFTQNQINISNNCFNCKIKLFDLSSMSSNISCGLYFRGWGHVNIMLYYIIYFVATTNNDVIYWSHSKILVKLSVFNVFCIWLCYSLRTLRFCSLDMNDTEQHVKSIVLRAPMPKIRKSEDKCISKIFPYSINNPNRGKIRLHCYSTPMLLKCLVIENWTLLTINQCHSSFPILSTISVVPRCY